MPINTQQLRRRLREFDFTGVMVEELGWDYPPASPPTVQVDGQEFALKAVAEKRGLVVYACEGDSNGEIPAYPVRQKIERQIGKITHEHLIIFHDSGQTTQYWQWVRRQAGKPAAWREQVYRPNQTEEPLVQKLQSVAFELEDEERQNIALVAGRVRGAFDVDRLTKRFYDQFKKEHETFLGFIEGINSVTDTQWYASLMLNRLMFVYFIQKKGFLDGDPDYLRIRLERTQQSAGKDKFQRFYRLFLLRLFHEGLGQPESNRAAELAQLLGTVPFLNGGLFEAHELEKYNPDIHIPDEAFEKLFDFFDGYAWHLDERPLRADNEINPDVLGYIFEKYINQKELGAYYTKEDITGYISWNTVIPSLFDAARKECPVAFQPDGGVWRLLREEPDRYIYTAVKKGVDLTLPPEIFAGIDDVSQRQGWNRPALEEYALPTETWREVVARRKRYEEVFLKLAGGEVNDINELITLNLDICRFAEDVIIQSEGPELVKAFWDSLEKVSILDPACGSGAFLFAALNVLEPLYTACLEGMRGFLDDLERSVRRHHPDSLKPFRDVLGQVAKHPNQRYFVLKSIVINNLYGVDIVEEAVEICKLRLFLKLVAQVETYEEMEPLPDIDFNIRVGNTLVGFTSLDVLRDAMRVTNKGQARMLSAEEEKTLVRIEEDAEVADRAFQKFREMQTLHGMDADRFVKAKVELRRRLDGLRGELDCYLGNEYGVDTQNTDSHSEWYSTHQPFHWFVEYFGIMRRGGFDVIIGNPPYVEYSKIRTEYRIVGYQTERCGNLYAFVLERCYSLISPTGRIGLIMPLSGLSTERMQPMQDFLKSHSHRLWASYYSGDANPSHLFEGVKFRLAIVLSTIGVDTMRYFSTEYMRWYAEERSELFGRINYTESTELIGESSLPKIGNEITKKLLAKIKGGHTELRSQVRNGGTELYYHNCPVNWIRSTTFIPKFESERDGPKISTQIKALAFESVSGRDSVSCVINSSVFFMHWITYSDCYHLVDRELGGFQCSVPTLTNKHGLALGEICRDLMDDFKFHSKPRVYVYKTTGRVEYDEFYPKLSKAILDRIDILLADFYGFSDEELDFIINYDIKYRLGGTEAHEE